MNKTNEKPNYPIADTDANTHPLPELEGKHYEASGKLVGKAAIVTGGDSGIGAAAAIAFAKEGADVAIVYHTSADDAQSVVRRIKELGRNAFAMKGDIGSESFCQRLATRTVEKLGRLDIVVNNAGEQHPQPSITDITQAQLERTFRTNIFSMFYLVKAALPLMEKGGRIINTSSLTAYKGSAELLDYSATKGAIIAFTRSLSQNKEVLDKKITVNAVAPGPVWTPLIPASLGEAHAKKFGKDVPLKRPGQPYELAQAYVYLAGEGSAYMTGQTLHINGGVIVNG